MMVSLWPWKGGENSTASFEKTLSSLATKITKSQAQLDSLRSNNRRIKALWTLYSSFAYLLCFIILFLVVGWQSWGVVEYTAIAGSPLLIYLIRTTIATYYSYRINTATARLESQQASRAATIDKLKAATRYNSTQELLDKYGEGPLNTKKDKKLPAKNSKGPQKQQPQRIGAGTPPPTANIQRPVNVPSQPTTPQSQAQQRIGGNRSPSNFVGTSPVAQEHQAGPPEFAPNAFSAPPQYVQGDEINFGGHWYDRVLDLLMGDDETLPKNRMALICQRCRLVNGQAPPGIKTPADLGSWRCSGCGTWNGEEDEATKAVKEMRERIATPVPDAVANIGSIDSPSDVTTEIEGGTEEDDDSAGDTIEAKSKPSRPKGAKK